MRVSSRYFVTDSVFSSLHIVCDVVSEMRHDNRCYIISKIQDGPLQARHERP